MGIPESCDIRVTIISSDLVMLAQLRKTSVVNHLLGSLGCTGGLRVMSLAYAEIRGCTAACRIGPLE